MEWKYFKVKVELNIVDRNKIQDLKKEGGLSKNGMHEKRGI